ncbi:hypothetical protein SAMN04490243_2724 [Robiginitalea myxolifaciens]|uniref:Uncharacterized protein n=1 Tax=Robiginitalea myxolifaciens TaxID=400055 RepID=A0A1I6HH18_9FLAO|nr:hypothetical protein [Robiginitalea myxolifaciens]SFR53600.1 hypothetical protein SAMN04490243_2724 [Robiginitalea myxolifaciens]
MRTTLFRLLNKDGNSVNSARKYFGYALGELILVIAGILIALQIYDWNDRKKELQSAIRYHERLIEDLDLVIIVLEDNQILSDSVYKSLVLTIEALDSRELTPEKNAALKYALSSYYKYNQLTIRLHAYDELKSTGGLNLIRNEKVRKQLSYYTSFLEGVAEVYRIFGESIVQMGPTMDKYFRTSLDPTATAIGNFDFAAMASNDEFSNHLSRIALAWNNRRAFNGRILENTKSLKTLVEEALADLRNQS